MTLDFGHFLMAATTFSKRFGAQNHLQCQGYKSSEDTMHVALMVQEIVTLEHWENETNGFSLTTFDRVNLQVWCLHSFCSKLVGEPNKPFPTLNLFHLS